MSGSLRSHLVCRKCEWRVTECWQDDITFNSLKRHLQTDRVVRKSNSSLPLLPPTACVPVHRFLCPKEVFKYYAQIIVSCLGCLLKALIVGGLGNLPNQKCWSLGLGICILTDMPDNADVQSSLESLSQMTGLITLGWGGQELLMTQCHTEQLRGSKKVFNTIFEKSAVSKLKLT